MQVTRGAMSYYKVSADVFFDTSPETKGDFQPLVYVQTKSEYMKVHRAVRVTSVSSESDDLGVWISRAKRISDFRRLERFFSDQWRRIAHHPGLTILSFDDDKLRAAAKFFLQMGITMTYTRSGKPLPVIHMCVGVHTGIILAFCLDTQGTLTQSFVFC